jgi:N4-gp56 family major capsid protein
MNFKTNFTIEEILFDLQLFADTVVPSNAADNMMTSTSPEVDPEFGKINDEDFVRMHEAKLVFAKWGSKVNVPMNSGTGVRFFKKHHLDPIKNPLTEGLTPNPSKFTITSFQAEIEQYGDWIMFTDVATQTAIHRLMKEVRQPQAYQSAKTKDLLVRDELIAGAQAAYASKADGTEVDGLKLEEGVNDLLDATCKLTVEEVRKMANRLKANDIEPAIDGDYVAIVHPDVMTDLRRDPEWKEWNKAENADKFENGEVGRVEGVRFVETSIAAITKEEDEAGGIGVYHCLFFGADAYSVLDLDGQGVKVIVKTPGSAGTADPLDQRCSVGWKLWNGAAIKDDLAIYDLMCASSKSAKVAAN